MLKISEKTANYAYDCKCEFNDVEFLEMNFRSSEWSPVHDAVTQLSLSQRIIEVQFCMFMSKSFLRQLSFTFLYHIG